MPSRVVDLDAMDREAGRIRVFGREVVVEHADAHVYRALPTLDAMRDADIPAVYALAARVTPSLTAEEVDRLTGPQVGAILAIAVAGVQQVEDRFPNSEWAASANPTTPPADSPSA